MAVGAHTGDAQLTCGMLLAKHAMHGDRVVIVDLTAGESRAQGLDRIGFPGLQRGMRG
jgi:LmbE family N-acetylglucosaminyl deacetylase